MRAAVERSSAAVTELLANQRLAPPAPLGSPTTVHIRINLRFARLYLTVVFITRPTTLHVHSGALQLSCAAIARSSPPCQLSRPPIIQCSIIYQLIRHFYFTITMATNLVVSPRPSKIPRTQSSGSHLAELSNSVSRQLELRLATEKTNDPEKKEAHSSSTPKSLSRRVSPSHSPARLVNLVPPSNYGAVIAGKVFRSAYPKPENFDFITSLKIRAVM